MTVNTALDWSKLIRTRNYGLGKEFMFPGIILGKRETAPPVPAVPDFGQYDEVPHPLVVLSKDHPQLIVPDPELKIVDRYGTFDTLFDFDVPEEKQSLRIDAKSTFTELKRFLQLWRGGSENWTFQLSEIERPVMKAVNTKFVIWSGSKNTAIAKKCSTNGSELFIWRVGLQRWKALGITLNYNCSLAISRNGRFMASYEPNGTLRCWRILGNRVQFLWRQKREVAKKPKRKMLIDVSDESVVLLTEEGMISTFNRQTGDHCTDISPGPTPLSIRLGTDELLVGGFGHSSQVLRKYHTTWNEVYQRHIRTIDYTDGSPSVRLSPVGTYSQIAYCGAKHVFATTENVFAFEDGPVRPYVRVIENVTCIAVEIVADYLLLLTKLEDTRYMFTMSVYDTSEELIVHEITTKTKPEIESSVICATASKIHILMHDGSLHAFSLKEGDLEFKLEAPVGVDKIKD